MVCASEIDTDRVVNSTEGMSGGSDCLDSRSCQIRRLRQRQILADPLSVFMFAINLFDINVLFSNETPFTIFVS